MTVLSRLAGRWITVGLPIASMKLIEQGYIYIRNLTLSCQAIWALIWKSESLTDWSISSSWLCGSYDLLT